MNKEGKLASRAENLLLPQKNEFAPSKKLGHIEGRIKTRKWTGEDGNDRYSTEVNVNEFTFLNTKKGDANGEGPSSSSSQENTATQPTEKDDLHHHGSDLSLPKTTPTLSQYVESLTDTTQLNR